MKNNREAQRVLYDTHAPKMLSVCRYYIKDTHHAEDVMLKGFYKVFKNLKGFKKEGSFEGWIRRIMVRECISFLRQKKQLEISSDTTEINTNYSNNIQANIDVSEIQQLIDELPQGYKVVFIMHAVEGYKHQEIAAILNISENTSKSQLFKARKVLQNKIKELNKTGYGSN